MRQAIAGILLIALLASPSSAAMACSCGRKATAQSILDSSSVVFTGVAQASAPTARGYSITSFKVTESFKGARSGAVLHISHRSNAPSACGVDFSPGGTYTLAANRIDAAPGLVTSACLTWMFSPGVGLRAKLINDMRALRDRRR